MSLEKLPPTSSLPQIPYFRESRLGLQRYLDHHGIVSPDQVDNAHLATIHDYVVRIFSKCPYIYNEVIVSATNHMTALITDETIAEPPEYDEVIMGDIRGRLAGFRFGQYTSPEAPHIRVGLMVLTVGSLGSENEGFADYSIATPLDGSSSVSIMMPEQCN